MAKQKNFPKIRGFEFFPEGKLLNQKVDFDGPIGIAYERCIGYTKPEHSHDRMTITFPRGSSRSFIKVFPEKKNFRLHKDVVHFMSQDKPHEQGSISTIYDTFAIFVTNEHYEKFLVQLGVKKKEIQTFLTTTQTVDRSSILNEIIQRYFLCRVLQLENHDRVYLESLLLNELFLIGRNQTSNQSPGQSPDQSKDKNTPSTQSSSAPPVSDETSLVRAIEFIESHLFEKLEISDLVTTARTSQATLFRLFKRDLKVSPIEYVRNRRLDEARTLLRSKNYQVSDVALLVGYEDLSSFSKAFKVRFGNPPSRELS
jgi:AraC-like DNA-binding protein